MYRNIYKYGNVHLTTICTNVQKYLKCTANNYAHVQPYQAVYECSAQVIALNSTNVEHVEDIVVLLA